MNIGEQIFTGMNSYVSAFRILDKHNLWSILILPMILSLMIAIVVVLLAWVTSDDIVLYVTGRYSFYDYDTNIGNMIELFISILIRGLILFFYLKIYRYLVLIVLSPVFVRISEILHKNIDGADLAMNFRTYCFCSFRGIRVAVRNFILELLMTAGLFLLTLIILWILPVIPAVILLVESYFFGMVMMDYAYEMDGLSAIQSRVIIRKNAGIALGNGLIFNIIILLPLIGVILGPILALVAARTAIDETKNTKFYVSPVHKPI
ncbi:MAG: EI24 domain-containing protein [Cyclobacteriaceae bacterium]|nr:EI24 domain-containing protein [Cyclobacteriaceae bacterium]